MFFPIRGSLELKREQISIAEHETQANRLGRETADARQQNACQPLKGRTLRDQWIQQFVVNVSRVRDHAR